MPTGEKILWDTSVSYCKHVLVSDGRTSRDYLKKMSHCNNSLLFTLSRLWLQQQIVSLGYRPKYGIDKPLSISCGMIKWHVWHTFSAVQ